MLSEVADVTGIVKINTSVKASVKALPVQIFVWWGGGELWIPLPPCSATYAWVRVTTLKGTSTLTTE